MELLRSVLFYDDPHTDRMFQTFNIKGAEYWIVESNGVILGGGGFYPTKVYHMVMLSYRNFILDRSLEGEVLENVYFNS